jgi:phosphatidylglycerophosphate synthase
MFNVPNLVSGLRLALIPILVWLAWNSHQRVYLVCLGLSLLTDMLDGLLARWLNQITELGAKLDSWADFATYMTIPFSVWWLWPDVIRREAAFVVVALISYVVPIMVGFLKYGRLTSYHTWLGKVTALLMGLAIFLLLAGGPAWPFRWAVPVLVLAEIEECLLIARLPEWRANVPTLWHALKLPRKPPAADSLGTGDKQNFG